MFRLSILCAALVAITTQFAAANTNDHVILITVDGCAAYYFDDSKAPIPNIRKLAAEGVVAKGMTVVNPAGTWPNHTTLVTGVTPAKHSVIYNGLMVRAADGSLTRESARSQAELIATPTVFDVLHGKGYSTAAINWPCTPKSTTLDFNMPDLHAPLPFTTPGLVKQLKEANILTDANTGAFEQKTESTRDQIWAQTACLIEKTARPNLMLLHFLITDSTQHRLGPQCSETYEALAIVDKHIGELVDSINAAGLRESTTLIVTADHGFARVHKQIVGNAVLNKAGLLTTKEGKSRVQLVPDGGTAMVYFHDKTTKEADRRKVIELFKGQEGIDRIVESSEYRNYGYPSPEKNPLMSDLVIAAKDDYSFSSAESDKTMVPTRKAGIGAHAYLSTNPKMNALFVASGRGITKGKKIGLIKNIDVAPTIARLLGENFSGCDGKVLTEILATP